MSFANAKEDNSHYIPLSDIMTALMLVFLFISVSVILDIQKKYADHGRCERITKEYFDKKENLYIDLQQEFSKDLSKWDAEINKDLSFKFNERTPQFDKNEAVLKEEFQAKLKEFFPRYIKTIMPYKDQIQEIRIEGHTDTSGPCKINSQEECVMKEGPYAVTGNYTNEQKNYLYNMGLSQARAKNVLSYCLTLDPDFAYMKQYVTANGLSYSKLITYADGSENHKASRRVEFKVLLKAEANMETILK